jgi:putative hydrolase of the HAD superfamily
MSHGTATRQRPARECRRRLVRDDDPVLVFDADDTLWENNLHFNRVVDDYLAWLAHPTLGEAEIRGLLIDVERANAGRHGYGSSAFLGALHGVFERLYERPATEAEAREVAALVDQLHTHQLELMPGVAATLTDLGARHELALLTKGQPAEQQRKIDASGLAARFSSIHIVAEKNADTYRRLTRELGLEPSATWMIGNSPKSDIIAARRADWNAVFIPNPHTWALEEDELDPDDAAILRLRSLAELTRHF